MKLEWDFSEWVEFADRLNNIEKFESYLIDASKELAEVLRKMLITNTPVKTGKLVSGWKSNYTVKKVAEGYEITLQNKTPYAYYVNYGHYSYNQYGGAYVVKNRTVPYTQGNNDDTFVFGRFFVEESVLLLENSTKVDEVILDALKNWFVWCLNG